MILKGTPITVTEIQKKDYDWFDGQFEELSREVNGKSGVILRHLAASPKYGEREAYMVRVQTENGERELELEPDEFVIAPLQQKKTLNPAVYTQKGELRKKPPHEYVCETCKTPQSTFTARKVRLPGVTFLCCHMCGGGKLISNPDLAEWQTAKMETKGNQC